MNIKFYRILFIFITLTLSQILIAETEGEKLFRQNEPTKAIPALENDISIGQISSSTYNFLALSYFQIGDIDKSIASFEEGLKNDISDKTVLLFNEGNVYCALKSYEKAEDLFSRTLTLDSEYYQALLNRANCKLAQEKLRESLVDYKAYIKANPEDKQKEQINKLISYLEDEVKEQLRQEGYSEEELENIDDELSMERFRNREDNSRLQKELEKQASEKSSLEQEQKNAERERRRRLLEELENSVQYRGGDESQHQEKVSNEEDVLNYRRNY